MASTIQERLVDLFGKFPVSWIVTLFGGAFVVASINSGRFFVESIATFILGIVSSYLWIARKMEEPQIRFGLYVFALLSFFLLWLVVVTIGHLNYFSVLNGFAPK